MFINNNVGVKAYLVAVLHFQGCCFIFAKVSSVNVFLILCVLQPAAGIVLALKYNYNRKYVSRG